MKKNKLKKESAPKPKKEEKLESLESAEPVQSKGPKMLPEPDDSERKLDKYELDSKLQLLMDAHEVMENDNFMEQIKGHAEKKKSKISSIADLRKAAREMPSDETKKPKFV